VLRTFPLKPRQIPDKPILTAYNASGMLYIRIEQLQNCFLKREIITE
jgi:hypothetical protein